MRVRVLPITIAVFCISNQASALSPGQFADNFRLNDHAGKSHELYYLSDMKAVVLMAYGQDCDASRTTAATIEGLRVKYRALGVEFLGIDSNLADTREAVAKQMAQAGAGFPILMDETQLIGESLGLARSGEVIVLNTEGWKVVYRGAVKTRSSNHLVDALDALLAGKQVKTAQTDAAGCAIPMPEREKRGAHARISYEKTIAPMLIENCVACHREGGIGPWQMSSYEMVRGFAPMIREVVRTARMPPWHADPHYGVFSNDRSLTKDEMKTLVHWIEAGSPRGAGPDPLAQQPKDWPEWSLGKPDLVVALPKFDVPATGTIPYQMVTVANPLDHDVWVRAIDFLPGDRTVLHHIIATVGGEGINRREGDGALSNYVPGAEPLQIPTDNGIFIPRGAKFSFQCHYTTSGKPASDITRMGLYFMKEPPKFRYREAVLANPRLKIPPNEKEHIEFQTRTFDREVLVYSLHPHSHFRGRAASFVAHYPDGREEVLLNVPRYDFNWQATYELTTPKVLPAGTKITYYTTFDNSSQNKANPDPNREVPWGQQTWDEMLYGVIRFRYLTEDATAKVSAVTETAAR